MKLTKTHTVTITPATVELDGTRLATESAGAAMLSALYRSRIGGYPKFFKMDTLSRLGFIAAELLLEAEGDTRFTPRDDRAVVLLNRRSSLCADNHYQATIADPGNYFPGPAQFVYTLPNIVTGEIAIRNKYYGETSFYVLPRRDDRIIEEIIAGAFADPATSSVIGGWLDCSDDNEFEAEISIWTLRPATACNFRRNPCEL